MNCNELDLQAIINRALKEDIGLQDVTTRALVAKSRKARAVLLAKEKFIVCGLGVAACVFKTCDPGLVCKPQVKEGGQVKKGEVLATLAGSASGILSAERVGLNFLTLLSGISTNTRRYVNAVRPYQVKILDTRKTIPGLRQLQKYAVRIGGGFNHRSSLEEMVLIKDNHLQTVLKRIRKGSSLANLVRETRQKIPESVKLEIEVDTLQQFKDALLGFPDIILLDNMPVSDIKKAVELKNRSQLTTHNSQLKLEASGGITLSNIKAVAATGVDRISVGALTHEIKSVDISLEIM